MERWEGVNSDIYDLCEPLLSYDLTNSGGRRYVVKSQSYWRC